MVKRENRSNEYLPEVERRTLLKAVGSAVGISATSVTTAYAADRSHVDDDEDGIPDSLERSTEMHDRLTDLYGDQFSGLDPNRKDLLIDARYVEGTSVATETKTRIVDLFRENGIHAQWLDHPASYERETFDLRYGSDVKELLWDQESFYRAEVEPWLRDIAIQVIVVPGRDRPSYEGLVYSPWTDTLGGGVDGHVNGFSVGNRAVIANRDEQWEEARLAFHEIAHFGLCHDDDPGNTGVMGANEEIDLMPDEWETLRNSLDNVRDATGYDIAARPCLWQACLDDLTDCL